MIMRKHVQVMDRYLKVLDEVLTAWENQYPVPWETIQERREADRELSKSCAEISKIFE